MADKKVPSIWDGRGDAKKLAGQGVINAIKAYFPAQLRIKKAVATVECLEDGRMNKADLVVEFYPKQKPKAAQDEINKSLLDKK